MSELTYEAIIEAVKKSLDYKPTDNPYVYSHADMHVAILAGREAERERIIKLLEERHRPIQNPCNNLRCKVQIHTDCPTCLDEYPCLVADEIALIKGENK